MKEEKLIRFCKFNVTYHKLKKLEYSSFKQV